MKDGRRQTRLQDYARVLRSYLGGSIDGRSFCAEWSRLNSGDRCLRDARTGRLLADFFIEVEGFEPDSEVLADLLADEPGAYYGEDVFKPRAEAFLRELDTLLSSGRMLDAVVRGDVGEADLATAVAKALGARPADLSSARSDAKTESPFVYDLVPVRDGFGTQVSVSISTGRAAPRDDHAFAAALAKGMGRDALVLSDPATPDSEAFFGVLHRPDGKAYRVPLRDLESGAVAVVEDESRWQRWTPPA